MLNTHGCISVLPEKLGVEVVNSRGSCAICRARPHSLPQTITFITDPSSLDVCPEHCFSVDRNHSPGRCHRYAVARDLYEDLDHKRSSPRPLTYRSHSYGQVHMYFAKVSTRRLFFQSCSVFKKAKRNCRELVWTN